MAPVADNDLLQSDVIAARPSKDTFHVYVDNSVSVGSMSGRATISSREKRTHWYKRAQPQPRKITLGIIHHGSFV